MRASLASLTSLLKLMVAVQKKEEAQGLLLLAASLIPIQIAKDAFASSSAETDGPRELPHGMGACVGMVSSLAFQAAYTSGGDRS